MLRFALRYSAGIFALGFVLGIVRTLFLAPRFGALVAVACELPFMLAASWFWARRLLRSYPSGSQRQALATGATAFMLLIASEAALAFIAYNPTPREWLASLMTPEGRLGLAGQVLFAVIPALAWRASVAVSK